MGKNTKKNYFQNSNTHLYTTSSWNSNIRHALTDDFELSVAVKHTLIEKNKYAIKNSLTIFESLFKFTTRGKIHH